MKIRLDVFRQAVLTVGLLIGFVGYAAAGTHYQENQPTTQDQTPDQQHPNPPSVHSATLNWKASDQPVNYRVYRKTGLTGKFAQIANSIRVLTYKDSTVVSGTTYYYKVSARNGTTGLISPYSNTVKAVIP